MQITVDSKVLSSALDGLNRTIGKPSLPVSTCIHMDADKQTGRIRLHSSDGAFHTLMSIPAVSIAQKGEALVEASLFAGLVKTFNSDITIDATVDNGINMKYKRNSFHVPGIDPTMALTEPLTGTGDAWTIDYEDLKTAVSSIEYARLKKNGNPTYNDVGLSIENDRAVLMTADSRRVALAKLDASGVPDRNIVIPAKGLSDAIALGTGQQVVVLEFFQSLVRFSLGDVMYYAPYSNAKFPPFHQKMLRSPDMISVSRSELIGMLTRADLVTSLHDATPGIIEVAIQGNTLFTSGKGDAGGVFNEEIDIVNPANVSSSVQLLAKFLLDAVKHTPGDLVDLHISNAPRNPVLVFKEGSDDNAHLMMPYRPDVTEAKNEAKEEHNHDQEPATDSGDQGAGDDH